jgi:uncharacterized protein YqgC (DUF456 family)
MAGLSTRPRPLSGCFSALPTKRTRAFRTDDLSGERNFSALEFVLIRNNAEAHVSIVILSLVLLLSLFLVPLGLPGTWIMIAAGIAFNYLAPANAISWLAIGLATALATVAEILEFTLSASYARKYGGSRRAGWGAIIGGLAGAFMGVPVPVIGSVIGAFAGAFAGALIAEYTRREATAHSASRVATGALIGRLVATALKMAAAVVIGVILVASALA